MKKLAIVITHPIQYYVPVFQLLAKQCLLKVFYTWGKDGAIAKYDPDFKQVISWDLPLLDGYEYEFLENHSKTPGSHHFGGIKNKDLISKVADFNPDAILFYGWAYQSHLSAMRYFKGKIPIWFRGDSTLLNDNGGLKSFARKLLLKWIYKHISKAFYVGTSNKAYFEKFGLKNNQLKFAPHAIDNNKFREDYGLAAKHLRETLGISVKDSLILFAGKLENRKNPELLLKAFIQLNLENTHLLFVGNGQLEQRLIEKRDASTKFIMTNIHFMDFQNQSRMPIVYQACDLFCLPSQSETWGLVINEAMACKKAVLVSDRVGCIQDLVKSGINGEIFKSNNLSDLKSKLKILIKNKSILVRMGIESLEMIKAWSFELQAKQIIKSLDELD